MFKKSTKIIISDNQNHRLSRWYAPRLQGDGTGSPTLALNYSPLATIALLLQMQ